MSFLEKFEIKRYIFFLIFFLTIIFVAITFYLGLKSNPKYSTKNLTGNLIPNFTATTLMNDNISFSNEDINYNDYSLINIWASWCKSCKDEHNILMDLSKVTGLNVYGINFKDNKKKAIHYLKNFGNPYTTIGVDNDGSLSINLGAYGVPESILIDKNKKIVSKYIGPLNEVHYKEILIEIQK